MTERVDYYEAWNRIRSDSRTRLWSREAKSLDLISRCLDASTSGAMVVDLGCGNGAFLHHLQKRHPEARVLGFDGSPSEVRDARRAGFDVREANLEERLPLQDQEIEVVYAGEVIEHLVSPDMLIQEAHRILRPGGHLVLSTPNLCAWFNRVLVPLGVQPLFLETSSRSSMVGVGPLKRFKKSDLPVGHLRLFTLQAVRDLLNLYGFEIVVASGASFDEGFPPAALMIDRVFTLVPSLSANLVIAARRR